MSERREIDKAIAHLMDWAERPEWVDEMNSIYDRNIVDAADFLDMEVDEIFAGCGMSWGLKSLVALLRMFS